MKRLVFAVLSILAIGLAAVGAFDYTQNENLGVKAPGDKVSATVSPPGTVLTGANIAAGGFDWTGGPASFKATIPADFAGVHSGSFEGTYKPNGGGGGVPVKPKIYTWKMDTTAVVPKVTITGFSDPEPYVRHGVCEVKYHLTTCFASIDPPGISAISFSIVGDAAGASIDVNTGVITPGVDESGQIRVRATAIAYPSCFDEKPVIVKARPEGIVSSTALRHEIPVGGDYTHSFGSTGGSLDGAEIHETVSQRVWPFRDHDFHSGDEWNLDAGGTMTEPDTYMIPGPGSVFVPSDFASFPQMGYLFQQYFWFCPKCLDYDRRAVGYGVIIWWLHDNPLRVKLDTSYPATEDPFTWNMPFYLWP